MTDPHPNHLSGRPLDRLILIRHGESQQNAMAPGASVTGTPSSWRLTARGLAQSRAAGRWLREILTGDAAIYTSPFERAAQTARLLDLGKPSVAAALADRDWGTHFSSAAPGEQEARRDEARRLTAADPWDWRPPGGESSRDLHRRVAGFLAGLTVGEHAGTVVVVSHGEVIRAARQIIEPAGSGGPRRLPNAGLVIYRRLVPEAAACPRYRYRSFVTELAATPPCWDSLPWTDLEAGGATEAVR